jgi:organic hydroperoxide reductase OsmC/OhrA
MTEAGDEPRYFPVHLRWIGNKAGELEVKGKASIRTGPPSDEVGTIGHSPEDLFVASATICYMNGFVEFAEKMRIEFNSFECDAEGKLERVGRSFEINGIKMRARVTIESEDIKKRIERALDLAVKYCFVGNSMKCPITHETEVLVP